MIVDVIVPVYNNPDLVRDCLESVIGSECSTKFELIVIDDASTDSELASLLHRLNREEKISLLTNEENLGFAGTANRGMRLHPDRDVLLLNSDTVVYKDWLDRLVWAAYSDDRIATSNPLTNSNGSHISYYPRYAPTEHIAVEVADPVLHDLAASVNDGLRTYIHVTVGFCMFIKRASLDDIGLFDAVNFPVGYGEESDFCYRAVKMLWKHVIAGDVFVTHLEGKSFGERKAKLLQDMFRRFERLHPECATRDREFAARDPIRPLRARLDLARVKRILGSRRFLEIRVVDQTAEPEGNEDAVYLSYRKDRNEIGFVVRSHADFPNLEVYAMPREIIKFNHAMRNLGVEIIVCASQSDLRFLERRVEALPIETQLEPKLVGPDSSAVLSAMDGLRNPAMFNLPPSTYGARA